MVGDQMGKMIVRANNWPFEKGEKAKLTWIGEPFKQNNKWMLYAYFNGSKAKRRILLDWASIHFLSVDKYYTDGNLNNGEDITNTEIIDINLNGIKAEYREKDWDLWGAGYKDKTKSKTFNFKKGGILHTIPIIEVIRAVLAPDQFLLNRILEVDTLENYFTFEIKEDKLDIHFTSEYEEKLLKNEKIYHLVWILTNPNIYKMFQTIGTNIWGVGELKFDFLFDDFNISAKVEKKEGYIRILQILSVKSKSVNIEKINIYHPSLEMALSMDEPKKRRYISTNGKDDRILDQSADGSTKKTEEINTFLIEHEYKRVPIINKMKTGRRVKRIQEDQNTKTYMLEDKNLRTTADSGGEDMMKGLEFRSIASIEEKGELEEFIELLRLLEKREDVKSIEVIIGQLDKGIHGKRFSRLNDGRTRRKYAVGKILMLDGREISLLEIEREDKSLSMLILKSVRVIKWKWVYNMLLFSLVNDSGKWSNNDIERIERMGIVVQRTKHVKKDVYEKVSYIYEKLA